MSADQAKQSGHLSQKDLMLRWGCNSVRTIQRTRKEYGLEPVEFFGINPLFSLEDVERVEEARRKRQLRRMKRQQKQKAIGGLLTIRQLRKAKGRK